MRHGNESTLLAAIRLPDGRTLAQPTPTPPDLLTIGAWVHLDHRAWRIEDLRQRQGGGRIVHVVGVGRRVLSLSRSDQVNVLTVFAAPPAQ